MIVSRGRDLELQCEVTPQIEDMHQRFQMHTILLYKWKMFKALFVNYIILKCFTKIWSTVTICEIENESPYVTTLENNHLYSILFLQHLGKVPLSIPPSLPSLPSLPPFPPCTML